MRNTISGAFEVCDISNTQIISSSPMGQIESELEGRGDYCQSANLIVSSVARPSARKSSSTRGIKVKSIDEYVDLINNLKLANPKMMDVAVPANMQVGLRQADTSTAISLLRRTISRLFAAPKHHSRVGGPHWHVLDVNR